MEATSANPFTPKATITRFPNATFEARIHLPGVASHVDVVPHENFILVTGSLAPRVRLDAEGRPSTLPFTDQPCGVFGRDIPVNLAHGTELVVLSTYQDCDDYVVRYTLRNSIVPRANAADIANASANATTNANAAAAASGCLGAVQGACGRGPTPVAGPFASSYAIPPAFLHRTPGAFAYSGYGHAHLYGYRYRYGNEYAVPRLPGAHAFYQSQLLPNGGATSF